MTSPKRAEPANEHAQNLRDLADFNRRADLTAETLNAAADEIERLAARVRELEESRLLISIDEVLAAANERPGSKPDQETKGER